MPTDALAHADLFFSGLAVAVAGWAAWYTKRETADATWKAKAISDRAEAAFNLAKTASDEWTKQGTRDEQRAKHELRVREENEQAKKLRLWMFAHEAVELHRRWVLYAGQAMAKIGISMSRPFEWIEFSTIEEYLSVGGRKDVVEAVYRVKQLNRQMDIQVVNAQESARTSSYHYDHDLKLVYGFLFNDDEWVPVCRAIRLLVSAAQEAGHDMKAESEAFEVRVDGGDKLRHALNAKALR